MSNDNNIEMNDDIDNIFDDNEDDYNKNDNYVDGNEVDSHAANQEFLDYEDSENSELEAKVYAAIETVYDPEIPVNIRALGLIYDVSITKNNEVVVLMTLTSPNCPVAGGLPVEVEDAIKAIPEINDAKAILTFDPAWEMDMMSEEAKFELGML